MGGFRPIPERTIEQWMMPRRNSQSISRGVRKRMRNGWPRYEAWGTINKKTYYLGVRDTAHAASKLFEDFVRRHYPIKTSSREET